MEILRDPLWNNIRLDSLALALIDTPVIQRLRYVRQLGHAFLVYPGATHSRFEHAVGAYHLAGVALRLMSEQGFLDNIASDEASIIRAAALLHDVGHYPFSHALEEIGATHHEVVAHPLLTTGVVAELLARTLGNSAPQRIHDLITGSSASPLQGLISGSLDLDKIEYLKRDAVMCGVPYGEIDVDRLLNSLVLVEDPFTGKPATGIHEKGLSALESLLFAKYQMYRNVYWHHAVRSATSMYKRLVATALDAGLIDSAAIAASSDDALMVRLDVPELPTEGRMLLDGLRLRRLHKRAFECSATSLDADAGEWIAADYQLTRAVENQLAHELSLPAGALLIDYPVKTQMLGLDLPMLRRSGRVAQLTAEGWEGAINLPRLSDELYRSARRLRVFTSNRISIDEQKLLRVLRMNEDEVREKIRDGAALLN